MSTQFNCQKHFYFKTIQFIQTVLIKLIQFSISCLLAYGLPKETVAAITILYRNTKVKVCS